MDAASPTPGRRERRKTQNRRALLTCAQALFTEQGIGATRIEDITERADVAKGVFYNYFPSKDDIIAELLEEALVALRQRYPENQGCPDLVTRLHGLARAHLDHLREHPEHIVLLHQTRGLIKLGKDAGPLQQVLLDYVMELGARTLGPEETARHPEKVLALGAIVTGTLAGCISYRLAVGLEGASPALTEVVTGAVEAWMASTVAQTVGQAER